MVLCYEPKDLWCRGPTRVPVKDENGGSNPLRSANNFFFLLLPGTEDTNNVEIISKNV